MSATQLIGASHHSGLATESIKRRGVTRSYDPGRFMGEEPRLAVPAR